MPDLYEDQIPGLGKSVSDGGGDPDGDTLTNLEEFELCTNPNLPDSDGDGFLDTWSFYRDGQLTRQERDLDANGFRDRIGFYQAGLLVREEEDRNGDGRPDRVTLFDEQERVRQRDEDRNGDGVVDLRSFYSDGRLIRRELLDDEASEEPIEEEELASAGWAAGEEVE